MTFGININTYSKMHKKSDDEPPTEVVQDNHLLARRYVCGISTYANSMDSETYITVLICAFGLA